MPCRDCAPSSSFVSDEHRREADAQRTRANRLARLLCHACDLLATNCIAMDGDLGAWHEEHEKADRARIAAAHKALKVKRDREQRRTYLKQVKARLVKQLDPDEREALGL